MTPLAAQYAGAIFGLLAAAFCIGAYFVPVPRAIEKIDLGFIGGGPKPVDDLDRFVSGTTWQGRLNGLGGLFALISAALQAWAIHIG